VRGACRGAAPPPHLITQDLSFPTRETPPFPPLCDGPETSPGRSPPPCFYLSVKLFSPKWGRVRLKALLQRPPSYSRVAFSFFRSPTPWIHTRGRLCLVHAFLLTPLCDEVVPIFLLSATRQTLTIWNPREPLPPFFEKGATTFFLESAKRPELVQSPSPRLSPFFLSQAPL